MTFTYLSSSEITNDIGSSNDSYSNSTAINTSITTNMKKRKRPSAGSATATPFGNTVNTTTTNTSTITTTDMNSNLTSDKNTTIYEYDTNNNYYNKIVLTTAISLLKEDKKWYVEESY